MTATMKPISSCKFGEITVLNKVYRQDLIIYPDLVQENWHRQAGHSLGLADLTEALAQSPKQILIGTGWSGLMKVKEEVEQYCRDRGLELSADKTADICRSYNQLTDRSRVIMALHLTC